MKKNRLFLGVIALLAIIGILFIGCDSGSGGTGDTGDTGDTGGTGGGQSSVATGGVGGSGKARPSQSELDSKSKSDVEKAGEAIGKLIAANNIELYDDNGQLIISESIKGVNKMSVLDALSKELATWVNAGLYLGDDEIDEVFEDDEEGKEDAKFIKELVDSVLVRKITLIRTGSNNTLTPVADMVPSNLQSALPTVKEEEQWMDGSKPKGDTYSRSIYYVNQSLLKAAGKKPTINQFLGLGTNWVVKDYDSEEPNSGDEEVSGTEIQEVYIRAKIGTNDKAIVSKDYYKVLLVPSAQFVVVWGGSGVTSLKTTTGTAPSITVHWVKGENNWQESDSQIVDQTLVNRLVLGASADDKAVAERALGKDGTYNTISWITTISSVPDGDPLTIVSDIPEDNKAPKTGSIEIVLGDSTTKGDHKIKKDSVKVSYTNDAGNPVTLTAADLAGTTDDDKFVIASRVYTIKFDVDTVN